MKKQTLLILTAILALILSCTVIVAVAAGAESRAATKYFEIYTADPETGASPAYTETASSEMATKLQEYVNKGDTWIVLRSDVTVTFTSIYKFTNSLYIDLNGHTLTLGSNNTDRTFSPGGPLGQVLEFKNGTLNSNGAKGIYPVGSATSQPDIRFTDLTINVKHDFSDHRSGGKLTFDGCVINFFENTSSTCNRFIYFGQRTDLAKIDVEIKDTVFNVSQSFKWNSGSAIFIFGNSFGVETAMSISGSTFNIDSTTLPQFLANGNNVVATVDIEDTEIYTTAPLLVNSSTKDTVINIGDDVVVTRASLDKATLGNTGRINFPDGYVEMYVDDKNVEYVDPARLITVSYYHGDEKIGEKLSKIGAVPFVDTTLDFSGGLVYSDGVLSSSSLGFYTDKELKNPVTVITAETDKIYVGAGPGEPCAWAAFSGTPSLETLVTYSKSDNEIITAVQNTSVLYIEAYRDTKLTHTAAPYDLNRNLTIDVKGNELDLAGDHTDKAFNPQSGVTLAIKNATIVSDTARLAYPGARPANVSNTVILENVVADWSAITMFDYRAGGTFIARGCEFDFSGSVVFAFNLLNNRSDLTLDMTFEDCVINSNSSLGTPFLTLSNNAKNCTVNVTVDGCTINAAAGAALIANKSESSTLNVRINDSSDASPTYIKNNIPVITSVSSSLTTLTLGNGIYLDSALENGYLQNVTPVYASGARVVNSANASYPFVITDDFVSVTFVNGNTSEVVCYEDGYAGTLDSSKTYLLIEEDGVKKVAEQMTAWRNSDGSLVTEFVPVDGMTLTGTSVPSGKYAAWVVFNGAETELVAHSLMDGYSNSYLPTNITTLLPAGGILRLYDDLTLTFGTSNVQGITPQKDSVIDLGGHKLTLTDSRFMNATAEGYGFTVKNGTVDVRATRNNIFYSNISQKGHCVFIGVSFVTADMVPPFDIRGGGLYLTDCKFDGTAQFLALSSRYAAGAPIYVVVEGCETRSGNFVSINGSASGSPTPPYTPDIDLIVRDSVIECGYLFSVSGAITEGSVVDLACDGVKVKCYSDSLFYLGVDITFNASFTESRFSHNPLETVSGFRPDNVTFPDGYSVVLRDDSSYGYEVAIPVILKWNLSLYTDFDINFYLATDGIDYVRINGEALVLSDLAVADGKYIFNVKSVSPDKVAEEFTLDIGYGGRYSVSYTLSIVDYATEVFNSNNTDATKRLVASAIGYVYSTYVYVGGASSVPTALSELLASDNYLSYLPAIDLTIGEGADMGNIATAIRSAQLDLDNRIRVRFNIKDGFSGTIILGGETYNVVDGINGRIGMGYIDVELDAFSLLDSEILVSGTSSDGGAIYGSYSFKNYILALKGTLAQDAEDLIDAIAVYSLSASEFKTEKDSQDNFIYERRGNSYVIIGAKNNSGVLVIPETYNGIYVTEIAAYAFSGCTEITALVIPGSVKTVGIGAFMGCTGLSSLTVSEGVEVIGTRAFENTAVSEVVIPDSTLAIGLGAFKGCENLASITVPFVGAYRNDSNNYFGYIFGAPSYVANTEYVPESLKTVILSDNVTRVPAYSFWNCENIENIVIGSGVKSIGVSAFSGCKKLTSIYIPATVTEIPAAGYYYNSPFYGCSSDLVIVTEVTDTSSFGRYWNNLSETEKASVIGGMSYDQYMAEYGN